MSSSSSSSSSIEKLTLSASVQIDVADPVTLAFDETINVVTRTGDGSAGDPWTFDFSTLPTPTNIVFNEYMLYATIPDQKSIALNLSGSSIYGTNDITIRTHRNTPSSNNTDGHNLTITNVRDIIAGAIDTSGNTYGGGYYSGSSADAGDITIGSSDNRAGEIRVPYIYARRYDTEYRPGGIGASGNINIYSDSDISIEDSDLSLIHI